MREKRGEDVKGGDWIQKAYHSKKQNVHCEILCISWAFWHWTWLENWF